jgi:signal transduction histidine kinase
MPLEFVMSNKLATPEEQIRFVRIALSSLDRLESLVNDFILLTSIDQGGLNPIRQVIDVENHIVGPIRKRMERYKSKNLEFIQDITVQNTITAPRFEFTRALVHLVDNALKFSPQNGKVKLTVDSGLDGGATMKVPVFRQSCGKRSSSAITRSVTEIPELMKVWGWGWLLPAGSLKAWAVQCRF